MHPTALLAATCAALLLATPLAAEEQPAKPNDRVEIKKEGHDAMPAGTKGTSEGTIVSLEKGKLVLKTADGNLLFMPNWKGGAPKDGGGLDAEVLKRLEDFQPGQLVKIAWTWNERRRIERINAVE